MAQLAGNRVAVLHGVNLDVLSQRDRQHYGGLTLTELEIKIKGWAHDAGLEVIFFQSNHEGEYVEEIHQLSEEADAAIVNPGAWSHYSYAIRDALEFSPVPAVEVHLSNIKEREPWRANSVISDVALATIYGKGPDGYREALKILVDELSKDR